MKIVLMSIISVLFFLIGLISFFSVGSLLITMLRLKSFDELERKAVFDSLGYSMLIILGLHLMQMLIGMFIGEQYQMWISAGAHDRTLVGNTPLRIESFLFDCFVVGTIYTFIRWRYRLIDKRYLWWRVIVPLISIIVLAGTTVLFLFLK